MTDHFAIAKAPELASANSWMAIVRWTATTAARSLTAARGEVARNGVARNLHCHIHRIGPMAVASV